MYMYLLLTCYTYYTYYTYYTHYTYYRDYVMYTIIHCADKEAGAHDLIAEGDW